MEKSISRREFLRKGSLFLPAGILAGCGLTKKRIKILSEIFESGLDLIVGFEGFVGRECDKMVHKISDDYIIMKSSTGVRETPHIAQIAHSKNRKVATIGYSLGRIGAEQFAEECSNLNVPINLDVVIDGVDPQRKISSNVEKVVQIFGCEETNPYIFRGRPYENKDFVDPNKTLHPRPIIIKNCGHLEMPEKAKLYVLAELSNAGFNYNQQHITRFLDIQRKKAERYEKKFVA